jgi:hypothetical protein
MIDEKEIRIGNYIKAQTKGGEWYECELTRELFLRWLHFGGDDFSEPIPLTEEWLLRFGFKKETHAGTDLFLIPLKIVAGQTLKGFCLYFTEDEWDLSFTDYYTGKEKTELFPYGLKYVHQLQNLYFALTGEELTIKQPKEQHD